MPVTIKSTRREKIAFLKKCEPGKRRAAWRKLKGLDKKAPAKKKRARK